MLELVQAVIFSCMCLLNLLIEDLCTWAALLHYCDEPIEFRLSCSTSEYESLVQIPVIQVEFSRSHVER